MENLQNQIRLGIKLSSDFHRLDEEITNEQFLEHDTESAIRFHFDDLIDRINAFKSTAGTFISSSQGMCVNSNLLYLKNREHEDEVEYEVLNLEMREFRSLGMTVDQIVEELDAKLKGFPIKKQDRCCAFIYASEIRAIYENIIGSAEKLFVKSRDLKSTTICELAFKNKFKPTTATEIESRRIKNLRKIHSGHLNTDEEILEPYQWVKDSCKGLNSNIKNKFKIDYNLFVVDSDTQSIRLNPEARIEKIN